MNFLVDELPPNCKECICKDIKSTGIPNTKSYVEIYQCRLTGERDYINSIDKQRLSNCPLKGSENY